MTNITKYILADEEPLWKEKIHELEESVKKAWKDTGEAAGQWSDWHDNFEYDEARKRLEDESTKLRITSDAFNNCKVISVTEREVVAVWKKVSLIIFEQDWWEKEVQHSIWGHQTPIKWRVSYDAPLIIKLMWKPIWEYVEEVIIAWKSVDIEIIWIE